MGLNVPGKKLNWLSVGAVIAVDSRPRNTQHDRCINFSNLIQPNRDRWIVKRFAPVRLQPETVTNVHDHALISTSVDTARRTGVCVAQAARPANIGCGLAETQALQPDVHRAVVAPFNDREHECHALPICHSVRLSLLAASFDPFDAFGVVRQRFGQMVQLVLNALQSEVHRRNCIAEFDARFRTR